ncbi:hypothetical protein ES703_91548 [subsurface metagenome]
MNINQIFKLIKPQGAKKEGKAATKGAGGKLIMKGLKGMGFSSQTFKELTSVMTNILTMSKKRLNKLYDEQLTVTQYINQFTEDPFIHGIFAFLLAPCGFINLNI